MRRHQPQNNRFEPKDEHEQPTEPMSQVILAPFSSPTFEPELAVDQVDIPAPRLDERPFPKRGPDPLDVMYRQPATPPVYPILPQAPTERRDGRPPGGAPLRIPPPHRPDKSVPHKHRKSSFPVLVRLFFFAVELVLLLSLLFPFFGLSGSNVWVGLVYAISAILVQPLHLLLENIRIPLIYGTKLYNDLLIVVALLAYGLLSRILARFLKALLHSR